MCCQVFSKMVDTLQMRDRAFLLQDPHRPSFDWQNGYPLYYKTSMNNQN